MGIFSMRNNDSLCVVLSDSILLMIGKYVEHWGMSNLVDVIADIAAK